MGLIFIFLHILIFYLSVIFIYVYEGFFFFFLEGSPESLIHLCLFPTTIHFTKCIKSRITLFNTKISILCLYLTLIIESFVIIHRYKRALQFLKDESGFLKCYNFLVNKFRKGSASVIQNMLVISFSTTDHFHTYLMSTFFSSVQEKNFT